MSTTTTTIDDTAAETTEAEAGALAERLFASALGAIDLYSVYLGVRLGLYEALAGGDGCTPVRLAAAAGIHPRYAREWLEQQTVTGLVECTDRSQPADERRFRLPAGHAVALLEQDSPAYAAPLALATAGIGGVMHQLLDAYRAGTGVPYASYGADFRDGQAGFNRPAFTNLLAADWIANGLPDIHARLEDGEQVRIADVACGAGWSSIALADAYPVARIEGFDVDEASIADARRNAHAQGVADRVVFEVADAAELTANGYDLVCIFEAVHDMSRPVEVLRSVRRALAPGGTLLVMDERAAESFAQSAGPIEAFLYGASVLHCLPVGMADQPSVGTGTVMRVDTMRAYAAEAGFADVTVLPIEHDLFRFYRCS